MFKHITLGVAIASLLTISTQAADFSDTIFFGDSLTDSGSFQSDPSVPAGGGKFTTNPGSVWSENVANKFGTNGTPSNTGGDNFAQGGARVTGVPGVGDTPAPIGAEPIQTQLDSYFTRSGGSADPDALYTVWAGANDVFVAAGAAAPLILPPADPNAYLATTAAELITEITRLQSAGARFILVPNLPDIGKTPAALLSGPAAIAGFTALSGGFNAALFGGIVNAGLNVIPVDTNGLFDEIIADPGSYGLLDVTNPACGGWLNPFSGAPGLRSSLFCTSADFVAGGADKILLFADGVHPTTAGHQILSDYVIALLEAPAKMSLLAEAPVKTRTVLVNTIYNQITGAFWRRPDNSPEVWASFDVARLKLQEGGRSAAASGTMTPAGVTVGVDMKLRPNLLVGAAGTAAYYEPEFAGGGHFEQSELAFTLYGAYRQGPLALDVVGVIGDIDYDEVVREIALGNATRTINGDTSGSNYSIAARGSYNLANGRFSHGPLIGVNAQWVEVDEFTETNGGSAGMSFRKQSRDSLIGSLGYQASYNAGNFLPFARVSLEHEFENGERLIGASLNTISDISFELPALQLDDTWSSATLGVAFKPADNLSSSLAFNALLGQNNVRHYSIQMNLAYGF